MHTLICCMQPLNRNKAVGSQEMEPTLEYYNHLMWRFLWIGIRSSWSPDAFSHPLKEKVISKTNEEFLGEMFFVEFISQ